MKADGNKATKRRRKKDICKILKKNILKKYGKNTTKRSNFIALPKCIEITSLLGD